MNFPTEQIKFTPAFVLDESLLIKNLETLARIKKEAGCKVLLALKGFAMHSVAPLVSQYLDGVAASSLNESLLGHEYFKKEVHVYAPAYVEQELASLTEIANHIVFNSVTQLRRFAPYVRLRAKELQKTVHIGLRINHGYSEVAIPLYNPCAPGSRFGVRWEELDHLTPEDWDLFDGFHSHTMCEQGADVLERTLKVLDERVGQWLPRLKWLNLGGGHHITRPGYDLKLLEKTLRQFKSRYPHLSLILEPGEAIALNTGYLVSSVLDVIAGDLPIAILDTSATAHMPDVIEMPYRPEIISGAAPGELPFAYRLGGLTCLAGDVIGDYSFSRPLKIGDHLVFRDMAHYTMVKTTQFNGINHPDIGLIKADTREYKVIKHFTYDDFKNHLS